MTDQKPPPVQYDPIFFPPGPQIGDAHDATNGLRYVWERPGLEGDPPRARTSSS